MADDAPPSCPVTAHRKVLRSGEIEEPGAARDGVMWRIGSAAVTREVLRHVGFSQAGFLSESVSNSKSPLKRLPLLFMDGPEHRRHRLKLARFFTPRA